MSLLFSSVYVPFALALGLLAALLVLELLALLVGGSILGGESELDLDPGLDAAGSAFDLDPGELPDLQALIAAADNPAAPTVGPSASGLAGALGLGATPFMIWFAALLLGFGISGLALQSILSGLSGVTLSPLLASAAALAIGLGFAKRFSRIFAAFLPSLETSATSVQFMGGLRGKVTQGVARRGMPAEIRVTDRHGNSHFLRCEPLIDNVEITEGSDVLTVRLRAAPDQWMLRVLAIG